MCKRIGTGPKIGDPVRYITTSVPGSRNREGSRRCALGASTDLPGPRVSALAGQVGGPVVHEPTSALEEVRAPIGRLNPVLDDVRQGCLDDLVGMIRLHRLAMLSSRRFFKRRKDAQLTT